CLRDKDPMVRSAAVESLGKAGDQTAIVPLIGSLKDSNSFVRARAAASLGELNSTQAVTPLISALIHDEAAEVRREAVISLGHIGTPEAKAAVETALFDKDMFVRGY